MEILFPDKAGMLKPNMLIRYYNIYYGYILNTLKYINAHITLGPDSAIDDAKFLIKIDGKDIVIDYSDHLHLAKQASDYPYYFKFHYSEGYHEKFTNVYPISPTSFYKWDEFYQLQKQIKYLCNSDNIINRQIPYSFAIDRRRTIQALLKSRYGEKAKTEQIAQLDYWNEINNCLVSVCVPGFRNNMLDRGQLQYMALGACTISPYHINILPFFKKILPDVHYIQCKDDYSDLIEKIEWCRSHRDECINIGLNAQQLFMETSTPLQMWNWVKEVINA